MRKLTSEIRAASRNLRRSPGFTSASVAILGIGIGANVAIFSIFHSILLNPLPFAESHRLVGFKAIHQAKAIEMPSLSASDFVDLKNRAQSFLKLAAYRPDFLSHAPAGGDPVQLVAAHTTEDFFGLLGVAPLHGRHFTAGEFDLAAPRSAVISHAAWRRHFGRRHDVIGRSVMLNDLPTTIVGVMPEVFREPEFVDVWLPFPRESPEYLARDSRYWTTIGRLRKGATVAGANAEAAAVAAALASEYPSINRGWTIAVTPLLEHRVGSMRGSLTLLVGAVALMLLVACVNLANLMLARGVRRFPELAVRLALGASPRTLARAVFLESILLASLGGILGAALAAFGLPLLAGMLPPGNVPRSQSIGVDTTALAFAAGVSVLTGIVFGLLPALQVLRANVNDLLKSGGARGATGRFTMRAQGALITGQIALTVTVLFGAALLIKSLLRLQETPPGFDPSDVLAVRIAPPQSRWETLDELARYYQRLATAVLALPGVESAGYNSSAPLSGVTLRYPLWVQGRPRDEGNADEAVFSPVSHGYFRTVRLPLLRGRLLDDRDKRSGHSVCVINQTLANRLFPGEDPIGKRIMALQWLNRDHREIVGIVGDTRQENLADPPPPQLYVPLPQSPWFFSTLLVRIKGGAAQVDAVHAALRRADPTLTMSIRSLEDNIATTTIQPRLRTALFTMFGAIALGLSAFGIYASMAFTVSHRVREIGVRMALGADSRRILSWILGEAVRQCAAGVALGMLGAVVIGHLLRGILHGVGPIDPWILTGLALFIPATALLASAQPACFAARLDPFDALQQE